MTLANGDVIVDDHSKQDIDDLRVSGTRLCGDETEYRTRATRKATMTIEVVSMTADQFNELTRYRLYQVWPEYSGRTMTRVAIDDRPVTYGDCRTADETQVGLRGHQGGEESTQGGPGGQ